MSAASKKVIAAYVPVIHRGYLEFFDAYPDTEAIFVFSQSIIDSIDYLRKDLRALSPAQQVTALKGLKRFKSVRILKEADITKCDNDRAELVFPDEDISRQVAERFKKAKISFYPVFLRWDRRAVSDEKTVIADRKISAKEFDKKMMRLANKESVKSSNIWRRVAALIVKDGKVVMAGSNLHLPTEHSLWEDGDPRSIFKKGVSLEATTDMHAEARIISQSAKQGLALEGSSIYVTNFPCPNCSKLIAVSGIKQCFYSGGYAVLDGEAVLKAYGVELVHVDEPEAEGHPATWVPYKK